MKVFVFTTKNQILPEIEYVCKLFSSILDAQFIVCESLATIEENQFVISYCDENQSNLIPDFCQVNIKIDQTFWENYLKKKQPLLKIIKADIIDIFGTNTHDIKFKIELTKIVTDIDIFCSAFYLISRLEETLAKEGFDNHGRFQFSSSVVNEDLISQPFINDYAKILAQWIKIAYGTSVPLREKNMSVAVTHDIDAPYYYLAFKSELSKIISSLKGNGKYKKIVDFKKYISFLLGIYPDPYDVFDYISKIQQERNIKSTWFILMESEWGLKKKKYAKQLEKLTSLGYEIGLHPGYNSYSNLENIITEKKAVKRISGVEPIGVRNHFLRFNMPETYKKYEELGFLYDSTIGYPDHEGFRAGICTPFKPFDINNRCIINIMEIPLIVMDTTLINYRKYKPNEALRSIKELVDKVYKVKGTIVLLWHNHLLIESSPEWRSVYEESIDYLTEKSANFYTCAELARKWDNYWR